MTTWKNYYLPQTLSDALNALAAAPGSTRIVAGGTDLLLDIQQGRHSPVETLIDVTALPETTALEVRQGELFIGAAVPLNRIIHSSLVQQNAPGLVEACGLIGGPQVRNTATLGGNVAHALPAADGTISLLAHAAEVEVASLQGSRRLPIGELFLGPGRSALDPQGDVLVGFYLPLARFGESSAHRRVMRPQGVAIAILNVGAWVARDEDRIADVRVAMGPAGPTPFRAFQTEAVLRGQALNRDTLDCALQALLSEARFRTSPHRATFEYRRHVAAALMEEALLAAWERAAEEQRVADEQRAAEVQRAG